MSQPNGILAMDPEKYREIDGVVFDLDSYARHCRPIESGRQDTTAAETSSTAPSPVFAVDPVHDGWYPPQEDQPPVPVMAGALPPVETFGLDGGDVVVTRTVFVPAGSGSGSGSYLTSYTTSYRTSFRSSGSGSYVFGSCTYLVGGYGLELI